MKRTRSVRALLAGLVLGLLGFLALPATAASAHAAFVGASPAQGSIVAEPPTQVVLTFSEQVNPITDKVRVLGPDGSRVDAAEPRVSGEQLIIPLRPGGANGTYLVSFRVLSADSHPVTGAYTYSVGAPSPGGAPVDAGSAPSSPVVTAAFPVARWFGYAGLMLMVGSALVLALLWPRRLDRRGPTRALGVGASLVAVATVAELLLQIPYASGGGLGDIRGSDVREVIASQYGAAHLIRLGVLGAALLLLRPIVRGRGWGADRVLLAVLATIGIATWSISGHPSATAIPLVTVLADMVHVASMSIWLGGLAMLAVFLLPRANGRELSAIVPVWSRWATYAVGALLLTGVAQALVEIGTLDALFGTAYGWLVLTKAALAVGLLGVALLSRRLVPLIAATAPPARALALAPAGGGGGLPAREPPGSEASDVDDTDATDDVDSTDETDDVDGPDAAAEDRTLARRLRRLVIVEALVVLVVLGVTSVLVQVTPARSASASPAPTSVQSVTLRNKLFVLNVDIQPVKVGINEVHLFASTPDGQPADIKQWRVRASSPSQGIEPIDASVLQITANHAIGTIGIPNEGSWRFTFTLRTSDLDQSTVTADFQVSP